MHYIGKSLIIFGIVLVIVGVFFMLAPLDSNHLTGRGGKLSWFGRLPGDIIVHKKDFTFYFPITTCILISVVLSLVFFLFFRR